jgi:micrococcal nuclease
MFKKISLFLLIAASVFTLTACTEQKTDADIVREVRDSIVFDTLEISDDIVLPTTDVEGVTIEWTTSNADYLGVDGTVTQPEYYQSNQKVSLTATISKGDAVVLGVHEFTVKKVEVEAGDIVLNTDETDNLELTAAYESSNFVANGIGEVSLSRCVDGDTAIFTEGGSSFTVRFLGIDTPESTAQSDPWGKAASSFTCDKLTNATSIVLQSDPASGQTDSYGRYLAWVWYDGRLLNLELVEEAYSRAKGSTDTYYGEVIFNVNLKVQFSKRRIWGETDPDYDYSTEGVTLTIEELVKDHEQYAGNKVAIHGIVTARVGAAAYIQQGDYGVYLYYNKWAPDLTIGNEVVITGLTVGYYPDQSTGAMQVSGYDARYSTVKSSDNVVTPKVVTISSLTMDNIGSFLKLEGLTVKSVYDNDDSFTITAEDSSGQTVSIRKDADSPDEITASMFSVGTTFTITAPLTRYNSNWQLMLTDLENVVID